MNIIVSPRRVTVRPVRLALLAGFVAAALTPLAAAENAGAVGTGTSRTGSGFGVWG